RAKHRFAGEDAESARRNGADEIREETRSTVECLSVRQSRGRASGKLLLCRQGRYKLRQSQAPRRIASPRLQELSKNISRLYLPAHARVGDGKPAAREIRCLLDFSVERDRFGEVALVAIGGRKIRVQVKVIRIEQKRPLPFIDCIVDAVVSQVRGGGNVTNDRRHGI